MKILQIMLILTLVALISCNNQTDNDEKCEEQTNEEQASEGKEEFEAKAAEKSEIDEGKIKKRISVEAPTVVNINDLEVGSEVFGITVKEIDIRNQKDFDIKFDGEFILEGYLSFSEYDGSIGFASSVTPNATLQFGDIEKPFFMWFSFRNNDDLISDLSEEEVERINQWQNVPKTLKVKNYKIIAVKEALYIGANAEFIEIVE